jgi:hypothetical protein
MKNGEVVFLGRLDAGQDDLLDQKLKSIPKPTSKIWTSGKCRNSSHVNCMSGSWDNGHDPKWWDQNHEKFLFLTVLLLFAQCKMHYWWLVTWLDLGPRQYPLHTSSSSKFHYFWRNSVHSAKWKEISSFGLKNMMIAPSDRLGPRWILLVNLHIDELVFSIHWPPMQRTHQVTWYAAQSHTHSF